MKTMKETHRTSWNIMMQIPTKAKTTNGIIRAIKNYTDCFDNLTQEEMVDLGRDSLGNKLGLCAYGYPL